MCHEFKIKGKWISNQGELKEILGHEPPVDKNYNNYIFNPDMCLCPVDLHALVEELQMKAYSDGINYFFGLDADDLEDSEVQRRIIPEFMR